MDQQEADEWTDFRSARVPRLLNTGALLAFCKDHADCRKWIANWIADVRSLTWNTPHDVQARYPSVSFLAGNVAIFNVRGNAYRLEVLITYSAGIVYIRWIGTHAEYSKRKPV
jgi:mRNA interferase HigB